ncbi:MAG: hypothetical protein HY392_03635 [Candidatus Diapherotrites archaeon]|nr:hypothetical protein [Candidatus Diapherotrites archaeon]
MVLKGLREKLKWLDPFTYVDRYVAPVVNPGRSETIGFFLDIFFAALFAFILYNFLGFVLSTSAPIVIVVSGSMEPVLYRGDIVVLQGVKAESVSAPLVVLEEPFLDSRPFSDYASATCVDKKTGEQKDCQLFGGKNPRSFDTVSIGFVNGKSVQIQETGDIIVYNSTSSGEPVIHRAVAKLQGIDKTVILTKGDSELNPLVDQQAGITRGAVAGSQIQGKALFKIPLLGYLKLLVFDDLPVLVFGCKNPRGCQIP